MSNIKLLDENLRNLIAAGEVVERPSNVVKELIENSIDASATSIEVSLIEGGIKSIKIMDNGKGMSKDDLDICYLPHTTSKISTKYDLFRINTLGFRGEAISSICAVSKMQIISNDGSDGYKIFINAGKKISLEKFPKNIGTTFIVENLFYNTPARLKYLSSPTSELASITFLVSKLALSNPNIAFRLLNNKHEIINTSGLGDIHRLFGEIYGYNVAKNLKSLSITREAYSFDLVFVSPTITRSNKHEITIVCNNRYITNRKITNKIIEGYGTTIFKGRYPIVIVKITVDPLFLDVNVHPKKTEIKISNEAEIASDICDVIKSNIKSLNNVANVLEPLEPVQSVKTRDAIKTSSQDYKTIFDVNYKPDEEVDVKDSFMEEPKSYVSTDVSDSTPLFETKTNTLTEKSYQEEAEDSFSTKEEKEDNKFPILSYIGIYDKTYIICSSHDGLYLVDQHAAEERVNYEKIYDILSKNIHESTELLIPLNITFTAREVLYIDMHIIDFQKIGITLESSGRNSYFLRSVPLWMSNNYEDNIRSILDIFISNQSFEVMKFRDSIAKQISCKASIKAHDGISKEEALGLIKNLAKCKNPYNCPHGRPVMIKFNNYDLEKMFKRVV